MKKMFAVVAIVASLFLIAAVPADARGGGGGGHGGGHGFHGGGHGFHGHGFRPARVVGGGRIWVGGGWGPYWGPGWGPGWGYPYGYPSYPAYQTPMVSEPQSFIQQQVPTNYWYYCESAHAYYPYVQQCPSGWLTVVPQTAPPEPPR